MKIFSISTYKVDFWLGLVRLGKKIEKFENFSKFSFFAKLKNRLSSFEIEKIFINKIVSKFNFKQYRLLKFSKSPILKL